MKVRDVMTGGVISICPDEPVAVAARQLTHYNIGILPVCSPAGKLLGLVTDRDLVTRCLAAERSLEKTSVGQVMTCGVATADPDMDVAAASALMGKEQVRRLPVVDRGRLCGMISLGDIAACREQKDRAAEVLVEITRNVSAR